MRVKKLLQECSIPFIALIYAGYYYSTVYSTPWEAQLYSCALIVGIVLIAVVLLLRAVVRYLHEARTHVPSASAGQSSGTKTKLWRFVGAASLFVVGIKLIGYFPAGALFLVITPYILGYKGWKIWATAALLLVFIYALFVCFLDLRLPAGLLV